MRNLAWSSSAFPPLITFWATVPVVSAAAVFFAAVLRAVVFLVMVFFAVVFVTAAFFAVVFFAGALAAVFFAVVFSAAFSAVSAFTSDGFSAHLPGRSHGVPAEKHDTPLECPFYRVPEQREVYYP
ncbi:hypothetical protein, partial [Blautia sp.]|uniref:hypothetical protein n=1 Tax=Blautia sp. TaxID=1955243 RepID=UPI003A8458F4